MHIITGKAEMQETAFTLGREGRRIAVVPTMGYLHQGHLSLIRIAREQAEVVIVTIFVNPTQFGPGEDFARYPVDQEKDRALCEAEKVDFLFRPTVSEMYDPGATVFVDEDRLSTGLCGQARPGHFRGVLTVVAKLFHITQPDFAVFGDKDAQQLRLIRRMVKDLDFPVALISGPTLRESDGLAMSSRNAFLDPQERKQAVCLFEALLQARTLYESGERNAAPLITAAARRINEAPLARIDYIELVDDETMEPLDQLTRPALLAVAVHIGKARLIDNIVLG